MERNRASSQAWTPHDAGEGAECLCHGALLARRAGWKLEPSFWPGLERHACFAKSKRLFPGLKDKVGITATISIHTFDGVSRRCQAPLPKADCFFPLRTGARTLRTAGAGVRKLSAAPSCKSGAARAGGSPATSLGDSCGGSYHNSALREPA